ncbi:MAG: RNA methyltransferase [Myxococcota bacterium]
MPSLDEPLLDPLRAVVGKRRGSVAVVEGALPVQRACASQHAVELVLSTPSQAEALAGTVPDGVTWWTAPKEALAALLGFAFHRGVLATVRVPAPARPSVAQVQAVAEQAHPLVVVAAGLTDPANVGALVRASAAFGAHLVLTDARAADTWSRKAVRASAGHVFTQPLVVCPDVQHSALELRERLDVPLLALSPQGEHALADVALPRGAIVAFGSEGPGLDATWMSAADMRVRIPMAAEVDSLNVAASAAVTLFAVRDVARR